MSISHLRSMTAGGAVATLLSMIMLAPAGLPISHAAPAPSSPTATPSQSSAPDFRISLTDKVSQVIFGDHLTYIVTAVNTSSTGTAGIQIRLVLPSGVTSTDPGGGTVDKQYVTWSTDLDAGKETTRTAAVTLDDPASENHVMTVVACVLTGPKHLPLVCTSDIDQLRGVPGTPRTIATAIPWARWLVAGGILLLTLAILVFLIAGRRRRRRAAHHHAAKPDDTSEEQSADLMATVPDTRSHD